MNVDFVIRRNKDIFSVYRDLVLCQRAVSHIVRLVRKSVACKHLAKTFLKKILLLYQIKTNTKNTTQIEKNYPYKKTYN